MESAGVKLENASLRWSRGNLDFMIVELEKDIGEFLKAAIELVHHSATQFAVSVELAFFED